MSCTSPLYRVPQGSNVWKQLNFDDRVRVKNGGVFLSYELLEFYKRKVLDFDVDGVQIIPCGQCTSCRLAYSRDWAIRCSLEASMHEHNYFLTLTYDDYHIPRGEFVDYSGEIWDSNLCRRDVQLFMKQLREYERTVYGNTGVKVFYCGEYGGSTGRPHYHLCLFGVSEIPDLVKSFKRGQFQYYKSSTYEGFWSVRVSGVQVLRGFVDISEVSFDSIAYTARYVMKKQQGKMKKDFLESYELLDPELRPDLRLQPFIGMSLKPGIASEYYEQNKLQIREEDLVKYQKKFKLFMAKPPRYFDRLFDREDHSGYLKLKRKRSSLGIAGRKLKRTLFSEGYKDRLERDADIMKMKEERYYVRRL